MTQLNNLLKTTVFITDGGLETDLVFNKKIDLPHFAAFPLLENPKYKTVLDDYYKGYMDIAKKHKTGFILESPTWRSNPNWGFKLGYSEKELIEMNKLAIHQLRTLKNSYENDIDNILISGCIGPRGDGYKIQDSMTNTEAQKYHNLQITAFKDAGADLVSAITMTYSEEALGVTKAAIANEIPVVISFTVETDGNLPNGESLKNAISKIDKETNCYPLYYMINCAHPSHFVNKIIGNNRWKNRIKGIRANASCKSHAELDDSTKLDKGNKAELANWYTVLKSHLPNLKVFGGCCGTDVSHIKSICKHILN